MLDQYRNTPTPYLEGELQVDEGFQVKPSSTIKIPKRCGIYSYFSGAGFLDLGFEKSGYEVLSVNEIHKPFVEIYKHSRHKMGIAPPRFGYHAEDIAEGLNKKNLESIQNQIKQLRKEGLTIGFIGGPPCPDFSVGGKNKGKDGENGRLSGTYINLIAKAKPDFFLFENVKGLWRTTKHRMFYESLKKKLSKEYTMTERLINSMEYGVAQDRERIILVGFRKDYLEQNDIEIKNFDWFNTIKYKAETVKTLNWPTSSHFSENGTAKKPTGIIEELTVKHWFIQNDVEKHPNAKNYFQPRQGLVRFQQVLEGDDSRKSYKRLHRYRYSPTAAYGNNEVHLHPYKARRISVAEALAIQSLPKEFEMPSHITLTDMFKSVGNGVPFLAGKALAENIMEFLSKSKTSKNGKTFSGKSSKVHSTVA
ncbi:MAG: DNA cytosine methyltransferase [Bacteroidia bacterium]